MRSWRVLGPLVVLLLGPVAVAQPIQPEVADLPPVSPPNREEELEGRLRELERKLEALSARVETVPPVLAPAPMVPDPELALAAQQDAAAGSRAPEATTSDASGPFASPLATLNPDMSFILDVGGAWFNKRNHLQQGGHAMNDNGLQLQGLELAVSAAVDPFFRFDTYFQLTEAELEEAYFTTTSLPWNLQARGGLMNAAFGRQNTHHLHSWNFANPSLSHTRFMSEEHFRGAGLELSALMPLPWYLNVTGQVFGTSEELGFNAASFGSSEATGTGRIDGLEDFLYVARMENFFELSTDWSLLVGLSESLGQSQYLPDGRNYLHGGDLYLKWRPLSSGQGDLALALTVEYLFRDSALESGRLRDHGGFAQLDAQLTRRWRTGLRFDTTSLWHDDTPNPEEVSGWQRRGSASVTFLPSHFSKLRLQGDLLRERERDGLQQAVFLQVEISAGEHGAHKF